MTNLSNEIPYVDEFLAALSMRNYSSETAFNYERDLLSSVDS